MTHHAEGRHLALARLRQLIKRATEVVEDVLNGKETGPDQLATAKYVLGMFVSPDKGQTYMPARALPASASPAEMAQQALADFTAGKLSIQELVEYGAAVRGVLDAQEREMMVETVRQFLDLQRAANAHLLPGPPVQTTRDLLADILR